MINEKPKRPEEQYFPIPINEFLFGSVLSYDLYIKLNDIKFVKLAEAGTAVDKERIEAYKKKGVTVLYISEENYKQYTKLNMQLVSSISTSFKHNKISARLISNINDMIGNLAFKKAIDETVYNETKDFCTKAFEMVSDDQSLFNMLESIRKTSEAELFHCTSVSFVSCVITRQMRWTYSQNIHKLLLGSMLHDIGKKLFPPPLFNKGVLEMSNEERREYEKHPTKGRDILLEITNMSSDIVQSVYEHHETYNGSGFPNGIRSLEIHPFARVIRVADDLCNYIYPKGKKQGSLEFALEVMSGIKSVEYDPGILKALIEVFDKNNKGYTVQLKRAFEAAVEVHSLWLARLKKAIETGKSEFNPEIVKTDNNCAFGKWLYNEFPETLRTKPAYEEIRKLHSQFHILAANILSKALQGHKEESLKLMGNGTEFLDVSGLLISRLKNLKNINV